MGLPLELGGLPHFLVNVLLMTQNSVTAQDTLMRFLELQEDLNKLVDWSNTWQMNFNIDKCAVMHIGHNNIQHNYTMANQQLIATEEQRDLGITIKPQVPETTRRKL